MLALAFIPAQFGMWLQQHGGWAGKVLGHHGANLDAASSKFLIVGSGIWLWLLLDSIWLRWLKIKDVIFATEGKWERVHPNVRAAVVLGYFLAFMAVILGFTQGLAI